MQQVKQARHGLRAAVVAGVALALSSAAYAAADNDGWPLQGLYRIDGGGSGAVMHCVLAGSSGNPPVPMINGCTVQSYQRTKDGMLVRHSCTSGPASTTVRRIDAKTWEYATRSSVEPGAYIGNMDDVVKNLRAIAEQMARHGPTAEDRANGARMLADWPKFEAELREQDKQRAAAERDFENARAQGKLPTGGGQYMAAKFGTTRWTRIADQCKQATK
jgi:hypothetical protein